MKKLFTLLLAVAASAVMTHAAIVDGTCGDNLTWSLNTIDSTLTIDGSGEMTNWDSSSDVPWNDYKSHIKHVSLPEGLTSIGNNAFHNCNGLSSMTIPNSVSSIGDYALSQCYNLISIDIPNSVISIGYRAFYGCLGTTSINVSTGNLNYYSLNGVLFNKDITTLIQYPCGKHGTYTIPNTVTSIENGAFSGSKYLISLTIPISLTTIKREAFYFCKNLKSVYISDMTAWCAMSIEPLGNPLDNGADLYLNETIVTDLVLPNSINSIRDYAFGHCTSLKSITIPNSVTSIGDDAFWGCLGLTSVIIPDGVTSVGHQVFECCDNIVSVSIGKNVTNIGGEAFSCSNLIFVKNYAIVPQTIPSNVFNSVDKSACTLYVPEESIDAYQAADVWKKFTNILPIGGSQEIETEEGDYTIYYVDKESHALSDESVTLHVPVAPTITGFTFVEWRVAESSLTDGITIRAIYQADVPSSAPAVYINPANPAQKLIKNSNVYILTNDKTYTITG